MAHKPRPYERFGSFLLFHKLEVDSLSELWRAGAIEGESLGPFVALRRFTGGDRAALRASTSQAGPILAQLSGTMTVRAQSAGTTRDVPWLAWEYAGGRSLAHIIRQAHGSPDAPPNPIPIDQALAIAEKVALALESTANLKHDGHRVLHGCLLPQFVWIAEDGDIRVAGHELHGGLLASLENLSVASEIGGFFAPEIRATRKPSPASEVFSIGAMLYALLTGDPPPDPLDAATFADHTAAATMMATDEPIPAEIRSVIERALQLEPAARYENPAAIREAISALTHGDHYAPTTFNLAFYVHNLLRTEMGEEVAQREKEAKVDVAPYLAPPEPRVADVPASFREAADMATDQQQRPKRRLPLIAAIVTVAVLAAAGGGYYMFVANKPGSTAAAHTATAHPVAPPAPAAKQAAVPATTTAPTTTAPVSQPLVGALTDTGGEPSKVVDETSDEAARKKLIEDEINRRLQAEMMKLQAEYDRKLKAAEAKRAPTPEPATSKPASPAKPVATTAKENAPSSQQAPTTETAASTPTPTPTPAPVTNTAAAPRQAAAPPNRRRSTKAIWSASTMSTPRRSSATRDRPNIRPSPLAKKPRRRSSSAL